MSDIQITVNEDRPGFVDMTFTKGKRKVYLFETSKSQWPASYGRPIYAPSGRYVIYAPKIKVFRYDDALLSAQAYAIELLNEPPYEDLGYWQNW